MGGVVENILNIGHLCQGEVDLFACSWLIDSQPLTSKIKVRVLVHSKRQWFLKLVFSNPYRN